jgi:hypothetical protein
MLDTIITKVQYQFNVSKKIAIALTVFLLNIVGTITLMCSGIVIASIVSGVPIFPIK